MDEKEIIPLIYAFLRGMKSYRKACEEVEKYFSPEKGKVDPELEDFIKNYTRIRKIISVAENLLGEL